MTRRSPSGPAGVRPLRSAQRPAHLVSPLACVYVVAGMVVAALIALIVE